MKYKVSIIVPIYGVERYIERCVRSLFEQTLKGIEYVFVDDCSPDDSLAILERTILEYPEIKSNITIIRLPENNGLPNARRIGLMSATGEYILHCDSDDWMEPNMCQTLYDAAINNSCDIVICDYYKSYNKGQFLHVSQEVPEDKFQLIRCLLNESVHGSVWNKLVSRRLYDNTIIYPKDNLREDLALTCQLVANADTIKYLDIPLYHYFVNLNSITQKKLSFDKNIERGMQAIRNTKLIEHCLVDRGIDRLYSSELIVMKIKLLNSIAGLTKSRYGKSQWRNVFPEIDIFTLLKSKVSFRNKVKFILANLRLYTFIDSCFIRSRHL